jgi:hypothetical protein
MTDPSDDDPGRAPAGTGTAASADALEAYLRAAHDLYRHSLPPDLVALLPADAATATGQSAADAAGTLADLSEIDPALRLHTLARAVNRAPDLVPAVAPVIGRVVQDRAGGTDDPATPPDAGGGDGLVDGGQDALAARLRSFAGRRHGDEGLTPARWSEFLDALGGAEAVADAVAATVAAEAPGGPRAPEAAAGATPVALVDLPGCNDEETVDTARGGAAAVRSAFRTGRPLDDVRTFVDPRRWKECGRPYWTEMAMLGGPESRFARGTSSGWVAVFREQVDVPIVGPVAVNLRVRYREGRRFAVADYRLAGEPAPGDKVTFDSGWLYAADDGDGGTHVEGLKAIRFAEPIYNRLPDLACDGGWAHFMVAMALGCGDPSTTGRLDGGHGLGDVGVGPATGAPADEVIAALGAIGDEWAGAVGRSLASHRASLTSAMARALAPTPDPRWVNDLVGMGEGAVSTAEATIDAWRRSLAELRRLGGL